VRERWTILVNSKIIHNDFPRISGQGAVSGYQSKLLLRAVDGKLVAGPTDDEVVARYDACEDLAQQLTTYAARKQAENSACSLQEVMTRIEVGIESKVASGEWMLSAAEITWVIGRVSDLLE
jgi:hypothetical protein